MVFYDYGPWSDEYQEHHRFAGQVAEQSARLEYLLAELLYQLLSAEREVGEIVVAPLGAGRRLDLLGTLVTHLPASTEARALTLELRKSLAALFERRNHLIHGTWDPKLGETARRLVRLQVDAKHARRITETYVTAAELKQLAEDMHAAAHDVLMVMLALSKVSFGFVDVYVDEAGEIRNRLAHPVRKRTDEKGSK